MEDLANSTKRLFLSSTVNFLSFTRRIRSFWNRSAGKCGVATETNYMTYVQVSRAGNQKFAA